MSLSPDESAIRLRCGSPAGEHGPLPARRGSCANSRRWVTFVTSTRIGARRILKERHHRERRRSRCVPVIMCTVTTSLLACTNGFTATIRTPRPAAVDGDLVVRRCRRGAGHHLVIEAAAPARGRSVAQAPIPPGRRGGNTRGGPRRRAPDETPSGAFLVPRHDEAARG